MKRIRLVVLLCGLTLLLASCGSSSPAGGDNPDPDPGNPPPSRDECRVTVTSDITIPSRFVNGPEECDYYFPGAEDSRISYSITSAVEIEAGTVLRFGRDAILHIDDAGSLHAIGTEAEPVIFEGELEVRGFWYGLCFGDNRASRLENVEIRWAGKVFTGFTNQCRGAVGGSAGDSEPLDIVNTVIMGSYTNGLNAHHLVIGEFSNNVFHSNSEYGVNAHAANVSRFDAASDYLGTSVGSPNGRPYVFTGGSIDDGEAHAWMNLNAPYLVNSAESGNYPRNVMVLNGSILVLDAGVRAVFNGDSGISVFDSGFGTAGTPDNPVVLTGLTASRGSWNGISFDSSTVILNNLEVYWGGRDGLYAGSIVFYGVYDNYAKELNGVHVDGSANCAVMISNMSLVDSLDVTYGTNNEYDLCAD